jgi:Protein of unknown function (DUF664)
MVADTLLVAARETLAESLDEIRSTIDGLTIDQLNARVAGDGTNPIAVIVTHALESTRAWMSIAVGAEPPPRDRPAEFRTVADDTFAGWVDGRIAECLDLVDGAETFDAGFRAMAPWRVTAADEPVTAAWALLHALAHLGEHVGHAHVMRDLLRGGASAS